ncbi:4519_t:CDS:2 [Diversispora eburnea]|uniref:4519_t:CDS:1 n=1 Tax=Diversispora eburnea TaxID=1213867 RepID=A0A9N9AG96_9GLOM|nr:4519_t:CDS:2 [Diversispora eburnea]
MRQTLKLFLIGLFSYLFVSPITVDSSELTTTATTSYAEVTPEESTIINVLKTNTCTITETKCVS